MIMKKNSEKAIVTTHELGNIILGEEVIPTPDYKKAVENKYIVQARGIIFTDNNARKGKPIKF